MERARNLKRKNACRSTTLFDSITCWFSLMFFWSCERLWHVIIANIPICNCTAENENQKTIIQKLQIYLLRSIITYFLVTTIVRADFLVSRTKFIWNMLKNFFKWHQKPFTLGKRIKLLRIEMNPQKIYSDRIVDSNFIGFIKIWPLSEYFLGYPVWTQSV